MEPKMSRRDFLDISWKVIAGTVLSPLLQACAPDIRPFKALPDVISKGNEPVGWIETDGYIEWEGATGEYTYETVTYDGKNFNSTTQTVKGDIYTSYTEPDRQGQLIRIFLPKQYGLIEGQNLLPTKDREVLSPLRISGHILNDSLVLDWGGTDKKTESAPFFIVDRVYDPKQPTPTPPASSTRTK